MPIEEPKAEASPESETIAIIYSLEDAIPRINESLKSHESTHRTLLTLCGFGLLTFSSITDLNMLLHNGSQSNLPILNIPISVQSLIWILPLIITTIYCIYIYRMHQSLYLYSDAKVDKNFSFQKTKDSIFDNYFEISLNDKKETDDLKRISLKVKLLLINIYLFWIPLASLAAYWMICLKKHDLFLSASTFFFFILCQALLIYFYFSRIISFNNKLSWLRPSIVLTVILITMILLPHNFLFSGKNHAIDPVPIDYSLPESKPIEFPGNLPSLSNWILRGLNKMDVNPFLDLRTTTLSKRPENWSGLLKDEDNQISLVTGANLPGVDLRGADLERSFLARANLREANLAGSYLRGANLAYADLRDASLKGAYIRLVNFRNTDLRGVNFEKIQIADYDDPTHLMGPNFQGARFDYKYFKPGGGPTKDGDKKYFPFDLIKIPDRQKHIHDKIKKELDIINDDIDISELLYSTKNLPLAFFGINGVEDLRQFFDNPVGERLKDLGFKPLTDSELRTGKLRCKKFSPNFSLEDTNFKGFDLSHSIFRKVNLRRAIFIDSNFKFTDFTGADLTGCEFKNTDLEGTIFKDSILTGATFTGCINIEKVGSSKDIIELIKLRNKTAKEKEEPKN